MMTIDELYKGAALAILRAAAAQQDMTKLTDEELLDNAAKSQDFTLDMMVNLSVDETTGELGYVVRMEESETVTEAIGCGDTLEAAMQDLYDEAIA